MSTNRCSEHDPATANGVLDPVRKLVSEYEASSVVVRERNRDDDDDGERHMGIDRDFVAGGWAAPRRRLRTPRRGGRGR